MTARGADVPSTKPLLEKLGVTSGARVTVLGVRDAAFLSLLAASGADVSTRRRTKSDLIFLAAEDRARLAAIAPLERWLRRDGAVWVVYPKGQRHIREVDVIQAGLDAGFVDNKIARFSDTHTAMRLVIPLARR